jgi:tRNA uridine 5-carboxymethylaminomethyl modification enzyme
MAVMIDDLTLHGVSEPYRMLTARAEYRLRLRANNASTRLTALAIEAGCVGVERRGWFERREDEREEWKRALAFEISSSDLAEAGCLTRRDAGRKTLAEWLRFELALADLAPWLGDKVDMASELATEVVEDATYAPYLERQEAELRDMRASALVDLGQITYVDLPGLSREMVERLEAARPATLADAGRIRGITPAALTAILVHARRSVAAA